MFKCLCVSIAFLLTLTNCSFKKNVIDNKPSAISVTSQPGEHLITDYGAVGDGKTDCAEVINSIIRRLPPSGGTIVIPEGDFLLNSPIIIDRSFVTIRGLNPGMRSNIDVPLSNLQNPGGGNKLIIGKSPSAIIVPSIPDVGGKKNRVSGVEIKDILITGGRRNNGIGINIIQDNDRIKIENIIGINLETGIIANAADAMIIKSCWISEVKNSIVMTNGIQNMISNCQLGAQPGGVTVNLTNQENFIFTNNHVYPNGDVNLQLNDCTYTNVSSNNFQSYQLGIIEINNGNFNLLSSNQIWMRLSKGPNRQFRGKANDYGVVRISGNENMITNSIINCEWVNSLDNPVTIRSLEGSKNSFYNLKIPNAVSSRVFFVNETTEISNSVAASNIEVDGNIANVRITY